MEQMKITEPESMRGGTYWNPKRGETITFTFQSEIFNVYAGENDLAGNTQKFDSRQAKVRDENTHKDMIMKIHASLITKIADIVNTAGIDKVTGLTFKAKRLDIEDLRKTDYTNVEMIKTISTNKDIALDVITKLSALNINKDDAIEYIVKHTKGKIKEDEANKLINELITDKKIMIVNNVLELRT